MSPASASFSVDLKLFVNFANLGNLFATPKICEYLPNISE